MSPISFVSPAGTTAPFPICRSRRISGAGASSRLAKHRLFYTLLKLRLPLDAKNKDANPLTFDFLDPGAAAAGAPVMTGHDNGLITLNVAEADDAERERVRGKLGELYRTLLGHFRHEIAHYYWDRLIADSPNLEPFRAALR